MRNQDTMKILIAEDDAMYTKLILKFLRDENVEFAVADDGKKAYEIADIFA